MSRVISLRDIKKVPGMEGYKESALIDPKMDAVVLPLLGKLGFSMDEPIHYMACNHRDMSGVVGLGYRAVGQISNDPEYLRHPLCPMIERLVHASKTDPSMAKEMFSMLGHTVNLSDDAYEDDPDFPKDDIVDTFEKDSSDIAKLTEYLNKARKESLKDNGTYKTPREILREKGIDV